MAGPLQGVRVIDMTSVAMGPYATQILADMGAEVVKVEAPEGDVFRTSAPAANAGMGPAYLNLNRNKFSVTLDAKTPADRESLLRLIDGADVFVSNVRPAALARLGLDAAALRARNGRLIHCSAVGFGQDGPYAARPAFDDIIQAMSGLADLQGRNSEAPAYVNTILADKVAGLTLAYAIPMALYERGLVGVPGTPELIGANAEAIATAEDRERFKQAMVEVGLEVPASGTAHSMDDAMTVVEQVGLPILLLEIQEGILSGIEIDSLVVDRDRRRRCRMDCP